MGAHLATLTLAPDRDYVAGQQVVASMAFTVGGVATDPTEVTLIAQRPGGSVVTYTYGGGTITRDGAGAYHVNITLDAGGVWMFHVKGTGAVVAATVDDLNCQDPFPVPAPPAVPGLPYNGSLALVQGGVFGPFAGSRLSHQIYWTGSSWSAFLPVFYVDAFGAVGDGINDDTAAIQAAANAAAANGAGRVKLSYGKSYRVTSGITCTGSFVEIDMWGAVVLCDSLSTGFDVFTFTSVVVAGISGGKIDSRHVYSSGNAVKFDMCTKCHVDDLIINNVFNGIWFYRSLTNRVWNPDIRTIFGTYGIRYTGTAANNCHQLVIGGHGSLDNPLPFSVDGHPGKTWATGLTVTQGDLVLSNGNLYQCSVGGVTAAVGPGPAGVPSTDPVASRGTPIVDNTARWLYVGANVAWILQEEWTNTIFCFGLIACLNGGYGFRAVNNDGSPGSQPSNSFFYGWAGDHNFGNAVELTAGADMHFFGCQYLSTVYGSPIAVRAAFLNTFEFNGGRVFGGSEHGVLLETGLGSIVDLSVDRCGGKAANTYDAVHLNGGVSDVMIESCVIGTPGNQHRYALLLDDGAGDRNTVLGNTYAAGVTGTILDKSYGASGRVQNADGTVPDYSKFGDGSDGVMSPTLATTLTRDMFWSNGVPVAGCAVNTAGYKVRFSGQLDVRNAPAGWLINNGAAGSNGAGANGGAPGAAGTINTVGSGGGGTAGTTGTTGAGSQPAAPTNQSPANGGNGGIGQNGGSGSAGAGGTGRAGANTSLPRSFHAYADALLRGAALIQGGAGGAGGACGGGDGGNQGGGGGGGGAGAGVVDCAAAVLIRGASTAAGAFKCVGGIGGNGVSALGNGGGGAGAGGGGGGWFYGCFGKIVGSAAATNAVQCTGGKGGDAGNGSGTGNGGIGGQGGAGGRITIGNLQAGTWAETTGSGGSNGTNNTGTTGGTGGAGGACNATL